MKAFITGVTGQDGYYLSRLLLEKNYEVHAVIRRSSTFNTSRIDPIISEYDGTGKFNLYYSDLLDGSSISNLINLIEPDEVYNLAAQSHVAVSFKNPMFTTQAGVGMINLLESIKNASKKLNFIRHLHLKCMVENMNHFLMKNQFLIQKVRMQLQKFYVTI